VSCHVIASWRSLVTFNGWSEDMEMNLTEYRVSFWNKKSKEGSKYFENAWQWYHGPNWLVGEKPDSALEALRSKDPDLSRSLYQKKQDFVRICVTGDSKDIEKYGAALFHEYEMAGNFFLNLLKVGRKEGEIPHWWR